MNIDYKLQEALANEQQIDVSMIPDIAVMSLPLDVKRTCLAISKRLQDQGVDDDPVIRLKRTFKLIEADRAMSKRSYKKGERHDN